MRGTVLIAVLALIACDPPGRATGTEGGTPTSEGAADNSVDVPENAIPVGDRYYMVPLAETVRGCRAYRPFSPTGRVPQAIYYRTVDGRFVTDRRQAVCE